MRTPIIAILLASTVPAVAHARTDDTISYQVVAGDTFYGIAKKGLTRISDYRTVQRLNHIRSPRSLPANKPLRIPVRLLRTEPGVARIASFRGDVRIDGAPAKLGAPLGEGARLQTGANAFVSVGAADGSHFSLPSQTLVRLVRLRRIVLTGGFDQQFQVEQGRARSVVVPQTAPGAGFRLTTPIAVSAVRGTEFQVSFVEGVSRTEVTEGTVNVRGDAERKPIAVEKGYGRVVDREKGAPVESLLPAPSLIDAGVAQTRPDVAFAVEPLPGASGYRVQIGADAGLVDEMAEQTVTTPSAAFGDLPDGTLFVRLAAISPSGLEGLPVTYSFRRHLGGVTAQAERTADGKYRFAWTGYGRGTLRYRFQLLGPTPDATPAIDMPGLEDNSITLSNLKPGGYNWRVGIIQFDDGQMFENWSSTNQLIVPAPSPAKAP